MKAADKDTPMTFTNFDGSCFLIVVIQFLIHQRHDLNISELTERVLNEDMKDALKNIMTDVDSGKPVSDVFEFRKALPQFTYNNGVRSILGAFETVFRAIPGMHEFVEFCGHFTDMGYDTDTKGYHTYRGRPDGSPFLFFGSLARLGQQFTGREPLIAFVDIGGGKQVVYKRVALLLGSKEHVFGHYLVESADKWYQLNDEIAEILHKKSSPTGLISSGKVTEHILVYKLIGEVGSEKVKGLKPDGKLLFPK